MDEKVMKLKVAETEASTMDTKGHEAKKSK